ncbi:NAD(P)-binding protein [Metschnikowia bicuspidata var. bicuspidata NRRL YB-4993]|uniref:NAD(P)-binding protein n=1 Tax=Metschnikowia bicuspidata var. bicuspidata NRRL YB-4993 TaxID=869754 RepID=A0A1A0HEY4_9ASCO|nr:NAD(P)-binding protein [Metschnikowia bicuspidata var. bicuspidata NRRL YB-4993]OBA22561.1 NAD(P)-binding protein [Metschnikowia bicuspidata var. bicuspidata NRRL YB-4993]
MPIDIISTAVFDGPEAIPGWLVLRTVVPALAGLLAVKWYFGGNSNPWKRELHGKVYIVTGGTAGLGAATVYELATKGAQVILLCRALDDPFTVDFIDDMREKTNNFMIYAEQCDLLLLHSVRLFATKWLDNQPPRRLDGVVCCASETIPKGRPRLVSVDGVELQTAVNYLLHFHLLTLLRPALHVQPADRDVRVVVVTCALQAMGQVAPDDLLWERRAYPAGQPWLVYGTSKLLVGMFARLLQRGLNGYERPDKAPCNVRVCAVNPGLMRTPATRRFLSMGSVWGLLVYVLLFPVWFVFFKTAWQGCQSVLFALLSPVLGAQDGGNVIQECRIVTKARREYYDYELQDAVFAETERLIARLEKLSAAERKKQEKALGLDAEKARQAAAKQRDIHEKPDSEADLAYKLSLMRKSMALPMGADAPGLFAHDGPAAKATGSSARAAAKLAKLARPKSKSRKS